VTFYEIPTLVNQAQMIAMIPRHITAGFQVTCIHPFNRDIFSETDFAPAAPTDCELYDATEDGTEQHLLVLGQSSAADVLDFVLEPQLEQC